MKTNITIVTERGQVSVPAAIRKRLKVVPGTRLKWVPLAEGECKIVVLPRRPGQGPGPCWDTPGDFAKPGPPANGCRNCGRAKKADAVGC